MDVNDSLVDAHLEAVPGLGTLTARRLTGGDSQNLGGNADGALSLVTLILSSCDDLSAGALKRLGLSASEGHSIKSVGEKTKKKSEIPPGKKSARQLQRVRGRGHT